MSKPSGRRGFSFVELMFAITVLSIGLLGVAGAMYVGVGQTQASLDETVAAAVARQAAAQVGQLLTADNPALAGAFGTIPERTPPTPGDLPGTAQTLQPAYLYPGDPRYAWVPMVRQQKVGTPPVPSPTADVLIAVLRATARPEFNAADVTGNGLAPLTFGGGVIRFDQATGSTTLSLGECLADPSHGREALAVGSFLILNPATTPSVSNQQTVDPYHLDGRVVRLGEQLSEDTWALDPSSLLQGVPDGTPCSASVFGRGRTDPADPSKGYSGEAQCVMLYATSVLLR